jgi:VWFA-related protein
MQNLADRRRTRDVFALIAIVALLSLGSGAQLQGQPPAPPAPPQPPVQPADMQRPTFSLAVQLVTTDAIVRDQNGQFVPNLAKQDFEIFEDGIRQEVVSLVMVHGGRTYNLQAAPPPPVREGIILPPARPTSDAAGRIFLLFVDDLHLDFQATGRIRDLFKRISNTLIHEGDMFCVVSTGPSSIAIDLTYDRKRLDEAIKKIAGSGLKPQEILQSGDGPNGPAEVRYRAQVAFSTALDTIKQFEQIHNRRKAVVYVSNGYDFNPFPEGRLKDPFGALHDYDDGTQQGAQRNASNDLTRQGSEFAFADLARDLSELTRTANRANATIYTIDPRGLIGGPDLDEDVDTVEWSNYIRTSQDSLRTLAELTGGIAVVNQNDFDKALKRIDAETSDYYVLGYYSTNPDPTRRTRAIEIKTSKPNLSVWSRRSYSFRSPQDAQKR